MVPSQPAGSGRGNTRGDTLLLLHGNPSWSFLYRKVIPALRDSFRCIALDYPGYGMSGVPDGYGFTPAEHSAVLGRFVDQLALSDLTIMVQDWGGPIGLGLAGRRPDLVRALIIGNTFAWPLNGNPDASHFLQEDVGERIAEEIKVFLRELQAT